MPAATSMTEAVQPVCTRVNAAASRAKRDLNSAESASSGPQHFHSDELLVVAARQLHGAHPAGAEATQQLVPVGAENLIRPV